VNKSKQLEKQTSEKPENINYTMEATAFVRGLFREFQEQTQKYHSLTAQLFALEGQIELVEKTLCLTRDHLAMTIRNTESAAPHDWDKVFHKVRFVGVRLADACKVLLQEKQKLTPEGLLAGLNEGMFRFRTNSPQREIHAALLRQSFAKKVGGAYEWLGEAEQQMPLRMRAMRPRTIDQTPLREGTTYSAVKGGSE
jgi:hypothetical protein